MTINLFDLNSGLSQKIRSVLKPVCIPIHYSSYTGLDNEFRTLNAGGRSHIKCRTLAAVSGLGHLRYGIGLGVENIGLGNPVLILANILKPGRSTVVPV